MPASTSRNGSVLPTCWPAFSSARPTCTSSVCASSISRSSGPFRTRTRNASSSGGTPFWPGLHVIPCTETCPGARRRHQDAGSRRSTSFASVGMPAGVSERTSTPAYEAASCCNQTSRAVLPLPRGPCNTRSRDGAKPSRRSPRNSRQSACSEVRPARYGGNPPGPGRNGPCRLRVLIGAFRFASFPIQNTPNGAALCARVCSRVPDSTVPSDAPPHASAVQPPAPAGAQESLRGRAMIPP